MSNTWQPTEQGLSDLLQLLREALNPSDSHAVQEVKVGLDIYNRSYSCLGYVEIGILQQDPGLQLVSCLYSYTNAT